MSVYVDPLTVIPRAGRASFAGYTSTCHLFADTDAELHKFAGRNGVDVIWLRHPPGKLLHYVLGPSTRALAIRRGAIALDGDATAAKSRELLLVKQSQ